MRPLGVILVAMLPAMSATAEDEATQDSIAYVPSLGEIMTKIELSRSKLWYSVRLRNWTLAIYQLGQVKSGFRHLELLYPMPTSDLAETDRITLLLEEAVQTKDEKRFDQFFAEMTDECNDCHKTKGVPFLHVGVPKVPDPYGERMLEPTMTR